MREHCDVRQATHVVVNGVKERIVSKWGVDEPRLAPPSQGGFGVVTESGRRVDMWSASYYTNEGSAPTPGA